MSCSVDEVTVAEENTLACATAGRVQKLLSLCLRGLIRSSKSPGAPVELRFSPKYLSYETAIVAK